MVFTKVKIAIAVLLVFGFATLGADGLISRIRATEQAAMPDSRKTARRTRTTCVNEWWS